MSAASWSIGASEQHHACVALLCCVVLHFRRASKTCIASSPALNALRFLDDDMNTAVDPRSFIRSIRPFVRLFDVAESPSQGPCSTLVSGSLPALKAWQAGQAGHGRDGQPGVTSIWTI